MDLWECSSIISISNGIVRLFYKPKGLKVGNCPDLSQSNPTFQERPFVRKRNVKKETLLEKLEFFEISHGSYQPLNSLPYLMLSTQYSILMSFFYKPCFLASPPPCYTMINTLHVFYQHFISRLCIFYVAFISTKF